MAYYCQNQVFIEFEMQLTSGLNRTLMTKQQVEIKSQDSNNSTYCNWCMIKHGVP
jgi:hypothetical protein